MSSLSMQNPEQDIDTKQLNPTVELMFLSQYALENLHSVTLNLKHSRQTSFKSQQKARPDPTTCQKHHPPTGQLVH